MSGNTGIDVFLKPTNFTCATLSIHNYYKFKEMLEYDCPVQNINKIPSC